MSKRAVIMDLERSNCLQFETPIGKYISKTWFYTSAIAGDSSLESQQQLH